MILHIAQGSAWAAALTAGRYENLEGGDEPFPHVYGAIELAAVIRVWPFRPDRDGRFELPADLES